MGRAYISVYVIWFQSSFQREEEEFMALKKKQRDSLYLWNYLLLVQVQSLFEGLPLKKKSGGAVVPRTITHIMTSDLQCFKVIRGALFKRKSSQVQTVVRYLWCETRSGD